MIFRVRQTNPSLLQRTQDKIMRNHGFWLILLVLIGTYAPCRAETLDDDSIRKIYAEAGAAIRDPAKSREMMETRLDDNFTLRSHMTRTAGNNPSQNAVETKSKKQAIEAQVNGMQEMKIENYENNIVSIQYSPDKKLAYVNDTSSSSGTVNLPASAGQNAQIKYSAKEACADILTLVGDQIKITQSDCNDEIVIGK
jgi:hypothetical protein